MSKQIYSTGVNIVKKKDSRKYAAGYAYLQAISEVNNSDSQEWTKKNKMNKMNKIKENCKRCAQT